MGENVLNNININENFDERSVQSILLDVSNRQEILKVERDQEVLNSLPKTAVEKKLQRISEISKAHSDISERKIALKLELETKLFELHRLLAEVRNKKLDDQKSQNKKNTAQRLIDKMNFMRKCSLIFLASDVPNDEIDCHSKLTLSRTLVKDKTLNEYIKTKKHTHKSKKNNLKETN